MQCFPDHDPAMIVEHLALVVDAQRVGALTRQSPLDINACGAAASSSDRRERRHDASARISSRVGRLDLVPVLKPSQTRSCRLASADSAYRPGLPEALLDIGSTPAVCDRAKGSSGLRRSRSSPPPSLQKLRKAEATRAPASTSLSTQVRARMAVPRSCAAPTLQSDLPAGAKAPSS